MKREVKVTFFFKKKKGYPVALEYQLFQNKANLLAPPGIFMK